MRRRQGFNRREKRALARILLAALILSLLFLALAPGCSLRAHFAVSKKIEQTRQENQLLLRETMQLAEDIRLLQHDERHLEKIAREKYGMLKKNEEVYYYEPVAQEELPAPQPDSTEMP